MNSKILSNLKAKVDRRYKTRGLNIKAKRTGTVYELDEAIEKLNAESKKIEDLALQKFLCFYSAEYDEGQLRLQGDYCEYEENKPNIFPEISKFKLSHLGEHSKFYEAKVSSLISAVLVKAEE